MNVAVTELANGMRVVTHEMPHLETASLGVWAGVGARFEDMQEHGISHLLEHMAFKGTARRSAREIAEEIESVGGDLNAATSLESTAYYARVLKDDIPLALDIIADILQNPRFDEAELNREKGVILQEIAASLDSPDEIAYDLAQEAAFPNQAVGRTILGTPEGVSAFTANDLVRYLESRYSAGNMVLAAAGAVRHEVLVKLARNAFAELEGNPLSSPQAAYYTGGVRCDAKRFEQDQVVLAFEGPSYHDDDFYAAQVLNSMLGGGMSSRLFQEARESRGLCYSIYSFCWSLSDTGLFGVHSATGDKQVAELLDVIRCEFDRIASDRPDPVELGRAKAQLKAGLVMSLESSGARAEQLARQMLAYGKPLDIDELVRKVESVSGDAVRDQAERLFTGSPVSMAMAGSPDWADRIEMLASTFQIPAIEAAE